MKDHSPNYGSQDVFYRDFYQQSRGELSQGLLSLLWRYPHYLIEKKHIKNNDKVIVEMGVGNGEHLKFVKPPWLKYVAIDLRQNEILANKSKEFEKLEIVTADAQNSGLPDNFADRVIVTCLIAHLEKPEAALRDWNRISKNQGRISLYMPCEGGFLLRLFRKFIAKPMAEKQGFHGYDLFILREHINSYHLINGLINELFHSRQIIERRRPIPFLPRTLNLFSIYEIKVQK